MAEVRTRDEALSAAAAAFAQWAGTAAGVLAQAMAAAGVARAAADAQVADRARRAAELADLVAMLSPEDRLRPAATAALARAQESLAAARKAAARLAAVATGVAALQRSHARNTETSVEAARADLARRAGELGAYRAAGSGMAGAGAAGLLGGVAGGVGPAAGAGTGTSAAAWLTHSGLADFSVAGADFSDNPIVGKFGRDGLTRADYRWIVSTWDEVIRPGLDRGMTRDDFAARDAASGARPTRRTVDVYDIFLGSDPICVERRPGGTVTVHDGRHRIEVARELGISHLPAKWLG